MGQNHEYSRYIASLYQEFTYTVRDSIHKDIPLSYGFHLLSQSQLMQKLHRIKQLGPTYLTYPGSNHTRYEHSLGVFHLTRLIIIALLAKSNENPIKMSYKGIMSLLCAAMMHDVGHFPYAHALKDIIQPDHEAIGASLIESDEEVALIIEDHIGANIQDVCQILDPDRECRDEEILLYRSILSGTLDPDKLDYLSRDASYCGVPYGVQDISYIIRNLQIDKKGNVCMPIDAIGAVEHLLFSKYLMYKYVYWHKRTRSATSMIKKSVLLALKDNLLTMEQLIDQSDESFAHLMLTHQNHDSGKLFKSVYDGELFTAIYAVSYNRNNSTHVSLSHEKNRDIIEKKIWEKIAIHYPRLCPYQVIVDIPEAVSFESNVHIIDREENSLLFHEIDDLFSPEVVDSFTTSLRKFHIYVPSFVDESLCKDLCKGIL